MLKAIQLENFKCYENSGRIPLAPLTLIFGPNSAGKSTILQALYLLMQTRQLGDPTIPLLFQAANGPVDLGSYQEVVHKHENRNICIRLDVPFECRGDVGESVERWYKSLTASSMGLRIEFTQDKNSGEVSLQSIWMYIGEDTLPLTVFMRNKDGTDQYVGGLGYLPLPLKPEYVQYLFENRKDAKGYEQDLRKELSRDPVTLDEAGRSLSERYADLLLNLQNAENVVDYMRILQSATLSAVIKGSEYFLPGNLCSKRDQLRTLTSDQYWAVSVMEDTESSLGQCGQYIGTRAYKNITEDPISASLGITHACEVAVDIAVEECLALGSVHPRPQRVYTFTGSTPKDVGLNGEKMPELLYRTPELLERVNKTLEILDMGYEITAEKIAARYSSMFEIRAKEVSRSCQNEEDGTTISLCDLGFGVGQLLPLVVQASLEKGKTILVEQPETHVHPGLQARLGTFFANNVKENNNQFIIETHSEHLILRLQRLIRDKELSPDLVKVLYVDPKGGEKGPAVKELKMDIDGEFIDDWPGGFFPERLREFLD